MQSEHGAQTRAAECKCRVSPHVPAQTPEHSPCRPHFGMRATLAEFVTKELCGCSRGLFPVPRTLQEGKRVLSSCISPKRDTLHTNGS